MITMTGRDHDAHLARVRRIHQALTAAQNHRDARRDLVPNGSGCEPGWVAYERETVTNAVNTERAALGLAPVAPADIARAEAMAVGHFDYTAKFAAYAADLTLPTALGGRP